MLGYVLHGSEMKKQTNKQTVTLSRSAQFGRFSNFSLCSSDSLGLTEAVVPLYSTDSTYRHDRQIAFSMNILQTLANAVVEAIFVHLQIIKFGCSLCVYSNVYYYVFLGVVKCGFLFVLWLINLIACF